MDGLTAAMCRQTAEKFATKGLLCIFWGSLWLFKVTRWEIISALKE